MTYLAVLLALAVAGMALAVVRAQGKLAKASTTADAAVRDAEQLRAALETEKAGRGDDVGRLREALDNMHKAAEKLAADVIACASPSVRRARLAELAQMKEIALGGAKPELAKPEAKP